MLRRPGAGLRMREEARLVVDFIACDGLGFCAEELPDHISLDDWGYPLVTDATVSGSDLKRARRAERSCPVAALRLEVQQRSLELRT